MNYSLSETEEWILRYVEYWRVTQPRDKPPLIATKIWPPNNMSFKYPGMPKTIAQVQLAAENLTRYDLLNMSTPGGCILLDITGPGLAYLRDLENPDLVEKFRKWSRRNPILAYLTIISTCLGGISGFVALFWNVISAVLRYLEYMGK